MPRYQHSEPLDEEHHLKFYSRIEKLPSDLRKVILDTVNKLGQRYLDARIDSAIDPLFSTPQGQLSAEQTNRKLYEQFIRDADAIISAAEAEDKRR